MENAQSPCPQGAHILCRETGTQVTDDRTGLSSGEVSSMGLREAGNNDFPLVVWEWLLSSTFPFSVKSTQFLYKWPLLSVLPWLSLCVYLDRFMCLTIACIILYLSCPCTGKVSCFLCFWVSRVGSWWTLWWTSAQTGHATECWQTLIDRSLVNPRLWTLLLHSPSIWVLTETHMCHILVVGFGSEWWYLSYKVLGVGEGRIICSRTRWGNRKKDKSENELLILAEAHLPLPQKCGCWPFPWGGLAEEQASGSWVDGL